ncbi:urease accessory protein, partial [Acinetobacter baumannii]|nr:urease accessory protein [Acinetobacter baumannii]
MSTHNAAQLLQLLTLSSAALPVGAYCYSQGVET